MWTWRACRPAEPPQSRFLSSTHPFPPHPASFSLLCTGARRPWPAGAPTDSEARRVDASYPGLAAAAALAWPRAEAAGGAAAGRLLCRPEMGPPRPTRGRACVSTGAACRLGGRGPRWRGGLGWACPGGVEGGTKGGRGGRGGGGGGRRQGGRPRPAWPPLLLTPPLALAARLEARAAFRSSYQTTAMLVRARRRAGVVWTSGQGGAGATRPPASSRPLVGPSSTWWRSRACLGGGGGRARPCGRAVGLE